MTSTANADARCPLCQEPNQCGLAAGRARCWCFSSQIDEAARQRVPEELRETTCLCERCATGRRHPNEALNLIKSLIVER